MKATLLCVSLIVLAPCIAKSQVFPEYKLSDFQYRISGPATWTGHTQNTVSNPTSWPGDTQFRTSYYSSARNGHSVLPAISTALFISRAAAGGDVSREDRCLRTGKILGALSGSTMGVFALYLGIKGEDMEGPFWKTLAISIPSVVIGGYVGARGTEWATRQLMKSHPKVAGAALKGVAYGVVDGALIGIASMVPLLTLGHLLNVINFNEDIGLLGVIATSTFGGAIFGAMTGAVVGLVYGPYVSLYMKY